MLREIPVFILAGGLGTRLKEETEFRPKPMVPIGGIPILVHIMRSYSFFGFKRFVICLGYRGEMIKEYFLHYSERMSDLTIDLSSGKREIHLRHHEDDWEVTLADTGLESMTGFRIKQAGARYLKNAPHFAVTYGDGLTNAALDQEFQFHLQHGKCATMLGVHPPSRFGEAKLSGNAVSTFSEKPGLDAWVNGGFFFFRRDFLRALPEDPGCTLEREPLETLAKAGELMLFKHNGFWGSMDTQRDRDLLEDLWKRGEAPWKR